MRSNRFVRIDPGNILLLGLSVIFALMAGEFAVRYHQKAWPFDNKFLNVLDLPSDEIHIRWHFHSRNSLKDYTGCRVLLLGDSVIAGLDMDAIDSHLGRKSAAAETPVSLIRMGNGGHTTYQELEFLRVIGLETRPRLVVLGIVLNDVYYKYLHRPTGSQFLDAEPGVKLHRFNTNTFPGVLFANSHLAHEVAFQSQILWRRLNGKPDFPFDRLDDAYLAWKDYGWDKTSELLAEMKEIVNEAGARLEAIIFPTIYQANETYRQLDEEYVLYPIKSARHILEEQEIPYLDLTETIYTNGGVDLYRDWVHYNEVGNQIVAKEIARYMDQRLNQGVCQDTSTGTP